MDYAGKVLLVQDASELPPSPSTAETFVIEEELDQIDEETARGYFDVFANASISSTLPLPWYRIVYKRFAVPQKDDRIRLINIAMLAERLRACLEEHQAERLQCGPLDPKYRALVVDVAGQLGITVDVDPPAWRRSMLVSALVALFGTIPFLVDQAFSIVWRRFQGGLEDAEIVFVPSVGRFDTMSPVLDRIDESAFELIVSPMTAAMVLFPGRFESILPYGPKTFSQGATVRTILRELRFLGIGLPYELFVARQAEGDLIAHLADETGVRLSHSVGFAISRTNQAGLYRDLLYYFLTETAIQKTNCTTVVVGSTAPLGKAVMAATAESSTDLYNLPHSETNAYATAPPFGATRFVSGELAVSWFEDAEYVERTDCFLPTGRPYLDNIYNRVREMKRDRENDGGPLKVTAATQPHSDETREEFVRIVLEAVDHLPGGAELTIKTHPEESPGFYRELVDETAVRIRTGNLYEELCEADLVVTINSSVGLDAMMAGAVTVCFDLWSPQIRPMSYAHADCVPRLRSESAVTEFFGDLTRGDVEAIRDEQSAFIDSEYRLDGRAADRIADTLTRTGRRQPAT